MGTSGRNWKKGMHRLGEGGAQKEKSRESSSLVELCGVSGVYVSDGVFSNECSMAPFCRPTAAGVNNTLNAVLF